MSAQNYQYYRSIFEGKRFPLAYVDLDLLDKNIASIKRRSGNKLIRVASKSIRCRAVIERIRKADEAFYGLMCFTAEEALWLADHAQQNLLIGYPTYDVKQLNEIAERVHDGVKIVCMIDQIDHLKHLTQIAKSKGVRMPVCLDVDMSSDFPGLHFGVWRSSIFGLKEARAFANELEKYREQIDLCGIMGYEAQIAGLGDSYRGQMLKNKVVRFLQNRSIKEISKRRAAVVDEFKSRGYEFEFVNGGGTGSLESTREEAAVTEVTAGSGFFNSHLFDNYSAFQHEPAAGFAIQIVRKPKDNLFTALGGGYIASGAIGLDKQPEIAYPKGAKLIAQEGTGEVQTPIVYHGNDLQIGDPVFLRHAKAGELCERFNEVYLVSNGAIVDQVATYRGEGRCFL